MTRLESPPRPGDIVWVDFTPTHGTEQSGRRPALIVSHEGYNAGSGRALAMPITSRVRGWPFEVVLAEGDIRGAVLVDQVRCIDWKARPARFAARAPRGVLQEARGKLAALVELS